MVCLHGFEQGIIDGWKVHGNFKSPQNIKSIVFFVESGVFEAEALLSNIAANSNGQIETRQEIFLSSCQNTRYKHLFFHSTVTSFALI